MFTGSDSILLLDQRRSNSNPTRGDRRAKPGSHRAWIALGLPAGSFASRTFTLAERITFVMQFAEFESLLYPRAAILAFDDWATYNR
jgi:hypothetical protein